ncbi:hypothetical protein CONPUDRAFT_138782 [Coniophora puteana RWD-64-598 SS2]|uniref:Autophagy-related protein 11 n=1 Tax=Coniophora puteana (strain RWD-64-598) TaxID=741705 RepID=A0A5M3MH71_CONPW|nr:uncharacterized protein CONPUDRAFT_138782 [Coniophora puteana RWD-64-598 SS2]EIW78562.1 hypothetical protein CONPUDRAFT_138782 [Coniophora puteana RWD-64-598 SS2]
MIQICRAEDGESYQVNATLRDIERIGSLEIFLSQETGVDPEAILAYLTDGTRLRTDNVRELVGAQDQTIYVFNKYYLDIDLDHVLQSLRVAPPLQLPIEENIAATPPFRPATLASTYLATAQTHTDGTAHILSALHRQHAALRLAAATLERHVLALADVFDALAGPVREELARQARLLAGVTGDLELVKRVRVHAEFMSVTTRKAIEDGGEVRTLGHYVSEQKMQQVAAGCRRTHEEFKKQFEDAERAVGQLSEGTDEVRAAATHVDYVNDAETAARRAKEILERMAESAGTLDNPATASESVLQELKHLDAALRKEVEAITEAKNAYTSQSISALRQISSLNVHLTELPNALTALQSKFRGKNSFSHIQRLHGMVYAYGATVVEVVRRKEFENFFYQRAQSIMEVMAKLTSNERKRRQIYRGEVHGQLPFDLRGMDGTVPGVEISTPARQDAPYNLEREDVEALLQMLQDLEDFAYQSGDEGAFTSVRDTKDALEKLVHKMDNLGGNFDRIAERSLLSASRLGSSRRRLTEEDEQVFQELAIQLQDAQDALVRQEACMQEERDAHKADIRHLHNQLDDAENAVERERERADILERELHQARAQIESETSARRVLERRHEEQLTDVDTQRKGLQEALADATEQARVAELLRQELASVRVQDEEVKVLEARNAARVEQLLEEQAAHLALLEETRAKGESLEAQIQAARDESAEVKRVLRETDADRDRLLRAQASEHDRIMRDHRAEADGDRAVLEHQFSELRAQFADAQAAAKEARAQAEIGGADAIGLREELQRVEHELREARHVERILREDIRAGRASQSAFEQSVEESSRQVAQFLEVAIAFRNSHVKAQTIAQAAQQHPGAASKLQSQSMLESTTLPSSFPRQTNGIMGSVTVEEPEPIDPSDPPAALETLRAFDHDHFLEVITKTGSIIRKWQKQCKEYRERAKGKISFRNFGKGDLALFLPTRNSVSKPWAAFNVSFPHYFLQATGHLAEQLKTREWIVARITSITERVVDHKDPSSNPYGLGDGVKYYMLEVEDWTQSSQLNKRRVTSRKTSGLSDLGFEPKPISSSPPTAGSRDNTPIPPAPPQSEVENAFSVTVPPTSHLFPVRARSNSNSSAGPSSLSRLLAQAPADSPSSDETPTPPPEAAPTPSPPSTSTVRPPPPSPTVPIVHQNPPSVPSPLRPGSRASRASVSSKFSGGRLPPIGTASAAGAAKAAPTTALTEYTLPSSPPQTASPRSPRSAAVSVSIQSSSGSANANGMGAGTGTGTDTGKTSGSGSGASTGDGDSKTRGPPSPRDSISEAMSNVLMSDAPGVRRRTSSYHVPRATSPLAGLSSSPQKPSTAASTLASFANSWGMSFGRRKRNTADMSASLTGQHGRDSSAHSSRSPMKGSNGADAGTEREPMAADLLRRV